ncbi:MAG: hypothetical protein HYZ45_10945 [Burkholderiales bacterium]|nr:hypothetical protein [Burkholderiales bacterium]
MKKPMNNINRFFIKALAVSAASFVVTAPTWAQLNVRFEAETHRGLMQIYANNTALLTGCGFGFIGNQDPKVDNTTNITTCNSNNGGVMRPFNGAQSPYLPHQLFFMVDASDPTKINFGGEYGPSPFYFASLSMPMDARRDMFKYFRSSGKPLRSYDSIGTQPNDDSYNVPLGPIYLASNGYGQQWGEIISDDYTIRITLTGTTKPGGQPLYFVNHPSTRNVEYSFNSVPVGEKVNVSGYIQVFKTDPSILPSKIFETEASPYHQIGRLEGDGWSVNVTDTPGFFMNYGPYTTAIEAGNRTATFRLQLDNVSADNNAILAIDVFDATAGVVLATRQITRREFTTPFTYQDFSLAFVSAANHQLEFRTKWLGSSYMKQDKVIVR